jgi:hypothetical protein
MIERNERLEAISDKIRSSIPVGLGEAIEAIDYQEQRRPPLTLWQRFKANVRNALTVTGAP